MARPLLALGGRPGARTREDRCGVVVAEHHPVRARDVLGAIDVGRIVEVGLLGDTPAAEPVAAQDGGERRRQGGEDLGAEVGDVAAVGARGLDERVDVGRVAIDLGGLERGDPAVGVARLAAVELVLADRTRSAGADWATRGGACPGGSRPRGRPTGRPGRAGGRYVASRSRRTPCRRARRRGRDRRGRRDRGRDSPMAGRRGWCGSAAHPTGSRAGSCGGVPRRRRRSSRPGGRRRAAGRSRHARARAPRVRASDRTRSGRSRRRSRRGSRCVGSRSRSGQSRKPVPPCAAASAAWSESLSSQTAFARRNSARRSRWSLVMRAWVVGDERVHRVVGVRVLRGAAGDEPALDHVGRHRRACGPRCCRGGARRWCRRTATDSRARSGPAARAGCR